MTGDPAAQAPRHPARKWIIATVVLLLAVVGLGVYVVSLRSDIDDKDDQIAAQQRELEERQGAAEQVQDAASGLADDAQAAFSALGDELERIQSQAAATQAETQEAIESAEQAAADAQARAESAEDEVEQANARADEAEAQAEATSACARGYLSAIAGAFDAASVDEGVTQAQSDIEALNASCSDTFGG
jgi:chromosome segregation ATPase